MSRRLPLPPVPAMPGVLAVPGVRRLEGGWLLSVLAELTGTVAVTVLAFRHGGPGLVGLYAAGRSLPVAVLTPVLMALPARRERLLAGTVAVRVVALLAAAATVPSRPVTAVALAAGASALAGGARPLLGAMAPWLARGPRELAGINVLASGTESVGVLAGPAVGGLLLAVLRPEAALAVTAALLVPAGLLLLGLRLPAQAREHRPVGELLLEPLRGLRDLAGLARPGGLLVLLLAQTGLRGVLSVLLVVVAAGSDRGAAGVGDLYAAMGAGGLAGGLVAAGLVRVGRLGRCFVAGLLLWGLPVALLGLRPGLVAGLVAMVCVGFGNALQDVAETTLTPTLAGTGRLPRVLGAIEVVAAAGTAAGAAAGALAVDRVGAGPTLVLAGGGLAALALAHLRRFTRIDRTTTVPAARAALLHGLELFGPLPMASVELLAGRLEERSYPAGTVVLREGESGDRWYLVEEGEVAVSVRGSTRRLLGPGEGFGEIALLRDVPRTATVTAVAPLRCLTLDREDFLAVVTGHPESAATAHRTSESLLALDPR